MGMAKRRRSARKSPEEIEALLVEYGASGQSQAGFAACHGIAHSTLTSWLRRSRQRAQGAGPGFVEVVAGDGASMTARADYGFELLFGERGKVRGLRVPPGFEAAALRRILEVVGEVATEG